jgi:undecaprenyl diphosphate synthase
MIRLTGLLTFLYRKRRQKPGRQSGAEATARAGRTSRTRPADDAAKQTLGAGLKIPVHLAIIMDGNGRWAQRRGLPRQAGHRAGADNLQKVVRLCSNYGIRYLTVYAFSTENWSRPQGEVQALMGLFIEFINRFSEEMAREDVRIRFSGDLEALPQDVRQSIAQAEADSCQRQKIQLIIAINYGGRRVIMQACRRLAADVQAGRLAVDAIDEQALQARLYLPDVPDPDLVIRPSGEQRISNFLIWESAYAEMWFSNILWPDFAEQHLVEALEAYTGRDRRFGGIRKP